MASMLPSATATAGPSALPCSVQSRSHSAAADRAPPIAMWILRASMAAMHGIFLGPRGLTRYGQSASTSAASSSLAAQRCITITFGGTSLVAATPRLSTSRLLIWGWPLSLARSWVLMGGRRRSGAMRSAPLDCVLVSPWCRCCTRRQVGLPYVRPAMGVTFALSVSLTAAPCGSLGRGLGASRRPPAASLRPVVVQ
jgi:hypothetical protein